MIVVVCEGKPTEFRQQETMKLWPGKRYVLLTALILDLLSFISLIIAFSTPYWYISWPRVYSGFRNIGLWEACFAGLVLDRDPTQKSYHGCWWILAPELWNIRRWVMPRTYTFFLFCAFVYNTSHHVEETDAGLDGPMYLRNKLYDKTLKSQNYYSNMMR